jgi:catechol 2,3-dioxygenase-like lactoylglutathione lyase family enzyme
MSDHDIQPSGSWSKRIFAVTLFVADLAASKRFYTTAFDVQPVFEDDSSAVFEFEGTLINLLSAAAAPELVEPATIVPADAGVRAVFTIQVDDVDALATALRAKGVALLNGPVDRPWGPRTASFGDPDGHVWELAH